MHVKRPLLAVISRLNEVHIQVCDLLLKTAAMGIAWVGGPESSCHGTSKWRNYRDLVL
jgi:hypothetical protein